MVLIYSLNGSIYGYCYLTVFNGTNTVTHPNPNGKLFVSIYGWGNNAGHSYVGGMKLNPINIQRRKGNYLINKLFSVTNLGYNVICKFCVPILFYMNMFKISNTLNLIR